MARAVALRVVDNVSAPIVERDIWLSSGRGEAHSLHSLISYPELSPASFFNYFIEKYSRVDDLVLDPFCGGGTGLLEAGLLGRAALGSDLNELGLRVAEGKLFPACLTELMLAMQVINLMRPIDARQYNDYFRPFYDINTFRELVNLKNYCLERGDRVSRFIQLVALSLLHGHSAGYFSAATFSHLALSPDNQMELNAKKRQVPDYRSVVPRILKRCAMTLRDGIPSRLRRVSEKSRVVACDARNLSYLSSSSVDLAVTCPPLPGHSAYIAEMWLRLWFIGKSAKTIPEYRFPLDKPDEWLDFMNEVLIELARVLKPGGRAVIGLLQPRQRRIFVNLGQAVVKMVENGLSPYWRVEEVFINQEDKEMVKKARKAAPSGQANTLDRAIVLRKI